MILDYDSDRRLVVCRDVPLRMNGTMSELSGARHVRNTDDWTVPAAYSSVLQLTNSLRGAVPLEPTEAVRDWMATEFDLVQRLHHYHSAADAAGNVKLYPLQRVAERFMVEGKRCINGYEMGGGKTPTSCDAVHSLASTVRSILVVCPKTVMKVWQDHFHTWCQDVIPIVAQDSSTARKKAIAEAVSLLGKGRRVALIMNYESVWRHTRLSHYGNLRMEKCKDCDPECVLPVSKAKCETCHKELNEVPWDAVIADEAHRVINISKQTRGLWYLTKEAEYVWALTGTPTRGNIADFWSLLHLVDPDAWPSRTKYVDRYCAHGSDSWGNEVIYGLYQPRADEFEMVTSRYMIRKTFDEIMESKARVDGVAYVKPERLDIDRYVEMSKDQKAMYEDIADKLFVETEDGGTIWADNGLSELTRLLQCASATLGTEGDGEDTRVIMKSPSPKVDETIKIMKDLPPGESVIVFTVNRQLADLIVTALEKEGISTALCTGALTKDERDEQIELFQAGDRQVFVATYATASEGITLTRASIQIRAQLSWSMILNEQSKRRNDRPGQESHTLRWINIITANSVESRVWEAYGDKLGALETITQDAKRMKELIRG